MNKPASDQQKEDYTSVIMERNFLRKAVSELNFHNNAHDGILYLDKDGKIIYSNPYFLEMMEFESSDNIINNPLPETNWEDPEDQQKIFNDVREYGFVREREIRLKSESGQPVFAMCSSVASKDDEGNFVGIEMMLCNVTSKYELQVQLEKRTKELERIAVFARSTMNVLVEAVQRGVEGDELLHTLEDLQMRLNRVTDKGFASNED